MLKVKDLHAYYGSIEALRGIDLEVSDKSIVCLIGSNGAGKTTLLKSISGMVQHTGRIEWDSENIRNYSSVQIARRGVLHVPEGRHVFPGLTVQENLEVGCINWRGFLGKKGTIRSLNMCSICFPGWGNGATSFRGAFRAASSRCLPWEGR